MNVGTIKAQNQAIQRAASARDQIETEEVKNELTAIEYSPEGKLVGAQTAFQQAIDTGDATKAKAAISALTTTGEKGMDALADKIEAAQKAANESGNHQLVGILKEYMMQAHGNVKEKNAAIHAWATSGNSTDTISDYKQRASTYAKLTDAQFSTQTYSSLESPGAQAALAATTTNADGNQESRRYRMLSNPESARALSDDKREVIANGPPPPPPQPQP